MAVLGVICISTAQPLSSAYYLIHNVHTCNTCCQLGQQAECQPGQRMQHFHFHPALACLLCAPSQCLWEMTVMAAFASVPEIHSSNDSDCSQKAYEKQPGLPGEVLFDCELFNQFSQSLTSRCANTEMQTKRIRVWGGSISKAAKALMSLQEYSLRGEFFLVIYAINLWTFSGCLGCEPFAS